LPGLQYAPGSCDVQSKNDTDHHHHEHHHDEITAANVKGKYYCPMRCEGDKTYDKPGDCPVCGMHLKKEEAKPVSGNIKTIYTCPMHPEVKQDHRGSCPKCGMDLVPERQKKPAKKKKLTRKWLKNSGLR
jgi:hypothetical protein